MITELWRRLVPNMACMGVGFQVHMAATTVHAEQSHCHAIDWSQSSAVVFAYGHKLSYDIYDNFILCCTYT
jgi:hypothetical protein